MARLGSWDLDGVAFEWWDIDGTLNGWWDRDLVPGTQDLAPAGIASEEVLGTQALTLTATVSGIASDEAVGVGSVAATFSLAGIASEEALGEEIVKVLPPPPPPPPPPPARAVFRGGGGSGGQQDPVDILGPLDDASWDQWCWQLFEDSFARGAYAILDPEPDDVAGTQDPDVLPGYVVVEKDVPRWQRGPQETIVITAPAPDAEIVTVVEKRLPKAALLAGAAAVLAIGVAIGLRMSRTKQIATAPSKNPPEHRSKSRRTRKASRRRRFR
jgi:hypothetical protein